jgi:hypothetical protein
MNDRECNYHEYFHGLFWCRISLQLATQRKRDQAIYINKIKMLLSTAPNLLDMMTTLYSHHSMKGAFRMKKRVLFLGTLFLCFALVAGVAPAWAIPYVESYKSDNVHYAGIGQYMEAGDWIELGFDFEWNMQGISSDIDENRMTLYQSENQYLDFQHPEWKTGWVDFVFWSGDNATESAALTLNSYGNQGSQQILGTYQIDSLSNLGDGYWGLTTFMDSVALASWNNDSYGSVTIEAKHGNFLLTSVSVSLEPVPEPGTIVLLGLGLFGLAAYGRKKQRK